MDARRYDLMVIGSGPAGQKGAINAAKLGKRVAVADGKLALGGVCLHTGTIPSKTLREAVLYLTGFRQRAFYGESTAGKAEITSADLRRRVEEVIRREVEIIRDQLGRNGIEMLDGHARFVDPHTIEIDRAGAPLQVTAEHVLIACGTRPAHSAAVPVDGARVLDSDQLLNPERRREGLARSFIVVGAGVVGIEYASMATALGMEVTVIDQRDKILDFVDEEILEALVYHLRERNTTFRLGEKLLAVEIDARDRVVAHLESGKQVAAEGLLYAVGREPNTDRLNLAAIGLAVDARGRIPVDQTYRTAVRHVYAAGDVIGFPALASTSMEQGRIATCHMFGQPYRHAPELLPYGIYTIPEISMVGKNEEQLTREKVPYEVGVARFAELARGQMIGDLTGRLKLLFHRESLQLLGVHIIGDGATELVHIGQTALAFGGTVEFLRDAVFNYPTLAEAYKVAAFDGLNRL